MHVSSLTLKGPSVLTLITTSFRAGVLELVVGNEGHEFWGRFSVVLF